MFCFKLKIPDNLVALRIVQSFIFESAAICGFKKERLEQFNLIAEEAFSYTIRLLKSEEENSEITVETEIDEKYFRISFFDKGMPFPKEEEYSEVEKIGLNLIKAYCSKLLWINLGKDGKELRLLFKKPQKDITQYELLSDKKEQKPSDDISIERLRLKDAYQVSRLIYKTYEYSYPNEDIYYPERIENMNRKEELISIVALDKKYDKIVGHYAIERMGYKFVAELGQAVVDPNYRGRNLAGKMRDKLEETAKSLNIKGLYSQPVTSHTRTQKINEKFNSKVCGFSFGLVHKELNYRKMEIKPLSERESCFLYFKPLVFEKRYVFLPRKHRNIMEKIYNNMRLEAENPKEKKYAKKSLIDAKYNAAWGFGTINVMNVGKNLAAEIRSVFNRLKLSTQAEIIFLNITLNDAPIDNLMKTLQSLGFFFCGVAPYAIEGKDAIRFQYLNTLVDTDRIQVYGEFAKEVYEYCVNSMKNVLW